MAKEHLLPFIEKNEGEIIGFKIYEENLREILNNSVRPYLLSELSKRLHLKNTHTLKILLKMREKGYPVKLIQLGHGTVVLPPLLRLVALISNNPVILSEGLVIFELEEGFLIEIFEKRKKREFLEALTQFLETWSCLCSQNAVGGGKVYAGQG